MIEEFLKEIQIQTANNFEGKPSMNATAEDQVLVEKLGFSKCNAI
jgi:hypothetical protein